ncbi:MBL fold metallo-hydrolase [Mongoliimonas terrestris]|uniref:MBL fold metallo-hydrolase n=1 Tax=Mongoliimonas terrestris TaxID=1709001 RepID=UPI0009F9C0A8|nr:MBL fold metallo-hydrolase [Mongoliimonas terrestris]
MIELGSTVRILAPKPHVLAFYDGRIPGVRAWSETANWLDDGAFSLGIATYAIVSGEDALVYDTHISLAHAALIRRTLADRGVRRTTVVLSHWHDDHVAGNAAFTDCEIVARRLTTDLLAANRAHFAAGDPPIDPLVMPTRLIDGPEEMTIGAVRVRLLPADIHSEDALLLHVPDDDLLLAGDSLEDPLTYVAEPLRLAAHLADLDRIAAWGVGRILPNHGDPDVIAAGGYSPDFIAATRRYVAHLLALEDDPALADRPVEAVLGPDLESGALRWWEPYRAVHARNVAAILADA